MPVDEFGREIPNVGGGGNIDLDAPLRASRSAVEQQQRSGGRDGGGLQQSRPRSSSDLDDRHHRHHNDHRSDHRPHRGGGHYRYSGGDSNYHHRGNRGHHHQHHNRHTHQHQHRSGSSDRQHHHHSSSTRRPSSTGSSGGGGGGSPSAVRKQSSSQQQHIMYNYVDEPLLCQFVWKDNQKEEKQAEQQKGGDNNTSNDHQDAAVQEDRKDGDDDADKKNNNVDELKNTDAAAMETATTTKNGDDDDNENDEQQLKQQYEEYKKMFCLNYIRSFFNKHMDDTWFRRQYSPKMKFLLKRDERTRRIDEAKDIQTQLLVTNPETFLQQVRLTSSSSSSSSSTTTKNPIVPPDAHLFSYQRNKNCIYVHEIPPHVTDEQILLALKTLVVKENKNTSLQLLPMTLLLLQNQKQQKPILVRHAVVTGPTTIMQDITKKLQKQYIPRKDTHDMVDVAELELDCSDPYGRLEYDADGRGGASKDGQAVPVRKATLTVSTTHNTPVHILSAALSSKTRFEQDQRDALALARKYDRLFDIPNECRLERTLQDVMDSWSASDILDTAIAYLRRVHYCCFYNACSQTETAANVILGKNQFPIHVRNENADEVLQQATTTAEDGGETKTTNDNADTVAATDDGPKDLLVQRLDDSIAKALENVNNDNTNDSAIFEKDAADIEKQEEIVRERWLQDHSITDADGRARCSFAFCHKLFKDSTFLFKHLLKKHREYLKAEQAKCHDEYMMKRWDQASSRPVPDILVDCGVRFGLVPTTVEGVVPDCVDPEPDLWQREEERRQREAEMRARREESRQKSINRPRPERTFVDVDDMKEEKVELSFENVTVPLPTSSEGKKKKKKKRKLL